MKLKNLFLLLLLSGATTSLLSVPVELARGEEKDSLTAEQSTESNRRETETSIGTSEEESSELLRGTGGAAIAEKEPQLTTIGESEKEIVAEGEERQSVLTLEDFQKAFEENPTAARFVILRDGSGKPFLQPLQQDVTAAQDPKNESENLEIVDALKTAVAAERPGVNVADLVALTPMTSSSHYPSLSGEKLGALFTRIDAASRAMSAGHREPFVLKSREGDSFLNDRNDFSFINATSTAFDFNNPMLANFAKGRGALTRGSSWRKAGQGLAMSFGGMLMDYVTNRHEALPASSRFFKQQQVAAPDLNLAHRASFAITPRNPFDEKIRKIVATTLKSDQGRAVLPQKFFWFDPIKISTARADSRTSIGAQLSQLAGEMIHAGWLKTGLVSSRRLLGLNRFVAYCEGDSWDEEKNRAAAVVLWYEVDKAISIADNIAEKANAAPIAERPVLYDQAIQKRKEVIAASEALLQDLKEKLTVIPTERDDLKTFWKTWIELGENLKNAHFAQLLFHEIAKVNSIANESVEKADGAPVAERSAIYDKAIEKRKEAVNVSERVLQDLKEKLAVIPEGRDNFKAGWKTRIEDVKYLKSVLSALMLFDEAKKAESIVNGIAEKADAASLAEQPALYDQTSEKRKDVIVAWEAVIQTLKQKLTEIPIERDDLKTWWKARIENAENYKNENLALLSFYEEQKAPSRGKAANQANKTWKEEIDQQNFSTLPNEAIFWTGYHEGNLKKAAEYAALKGKKMLEKTCGGAWLAQHNLYEGESYYSKSSADPIWSYVSEKFVSGVSGHAIAFVPRKCDPNTIYHTIEKPILNRKPDVFLSQKFPHESSKPCLTPQQQRALEAHEKVILGSLNKAEAAWKKIETFDEFKTYREDFLRDHTIRDVVKEVREELQKLDPQHWSPFLEKADGLISSWEALCNVVIQLHWDKPAQAQVVQASDVRRSFKKAEGLETLNNWKGHYDWLADAVQSIDYYIFRAYRDSHDNELAARWKQNCLNHDERHQERMLSLPYSRPFTK